MRLHPKSNAIAKHGEWNWIKERLLQDFKDEQKETKAEWIKGGKTLKRKRETTELDFKRTWIEKGKNGVGHPKAFEVPTKKEHRYGWKHTCVDERQS